MIIDKLKKHLQEKKDKNEKEIEKMTEKENEVKNEEVEVKETETETEKKADEPENKEEPKEEKEVVEEEENKEEETTDEQPEVQETPEMGNGIRVEDIVTKDMLAERLSALEAKFEAVVNENKGLKDELSKMQDKYEKSDFGNNVKQGVVEQNKNVNDSFDNYSRQFM